MDKEIIDLKEFNKKYIVLSQSRDFATHTIKLVVYDLEEKVNKMLKFDEAWFYRYMCNL